VYVVNLRPELPETAGLGAADHLRVLADHGIPVDVAITDSRWWERGSEEGAVAAGTLVVDAELCDDPAAGHDPARLATALRAALRT
jgi:hypothetical protein